MSPQTSRYLTMLPGDRIAEVGKIALAHVHYGHTVTPTSLSQHYLPTPLQDIVGIQTRS